MSIDPETAEREFERFASAHRVNLDESKMKDADREKLSALREVVEAAIQNGHVEVDESGSPTVNLVFPFELQGKRYEAVKFGRAKGSTLRAIDGISEDEPIRRSYALMAKLCGTSTAIFDEMDMADMKVMQELVSVFF